MTKNISNKSILCSSDISYNLSKLILALVFLKNLRIFLLHLYFFFSLKEGVGVTFFIVDMGLQIPFLLHVIALHTFSLFDLEFESDPNSSLD